MKRRSAATAGVVKTRPIELLPRTFFLLIVHETPTMRMAPASVDSTPADSSIHKRLAPPVFPPTPGIQFVELDDGFAHPAQHERRLDAAHTIRFCRFMNAMRRNHLQAQVVAATSRERDASQANQSSRGVGRASQIHFFVRSFVRGDEGALVQLLIRWRLLCLHLSPHDALAPFQHLQWLFRSDFVSVRDSLAGIAKGFALEILYSRKELDACDSLNGSVDSSSGDESSHLLRVTKRFIVFASPADHVVALDTPRPTDPDSERPPTGAIAIPVGSEPSSLSPLVDRPSCLPNMACREIQRRSVAQLVPLLKRQGVAMVVKLNAVPRYDDQLIVRSGIDHLDLSGHSDNDGMDRSVVARFLESCEHASPHGVVAVHSSSGLGRAAFCIGCVLVKQLEFTAAEAIGWIRFCCPGAMPSWYEALMHRMQATLTRQGDHYRRLGAHQNQTGSLSSPRPRDDGAYTGSPLTPLTLPLRLASEINIGKMSLGRDSLLGTKDKSARDRDIGASSSSSSSAVVKSLGPASPAQGVPVARLSGSHRELLAAQQLIASDATLLRRRPLTQGAAGRRRLLDHYAGNSNTGNSNTGTSTRDVAAIRKFLYQSSACSSSPSAATTLRPPATAPDRRMNTTPPSRGHSQTELTFD